MSSQSPGTGRLRRVEEEDHFELDREPKDLYVYTYIESLVECERVTDGQGSDLFRPRPAAPGRFPLASPGSGVNGDQSKPPFPPRQKGCTGFWLVLASLSETLSPVVNAMLTSISFPEVSLCP